MTSNPGQPEQVAILVVDDHRENLLALTGILDRPDYRIVTDGYFGALAIPIVG